MSTMHKDGGGDGKSNGIKRMSVPGGTLETSFPADKDGGTINGSATGKFGGSDTNLAHSLRGTSAVQK